MNEKQALQLISLLESIVEITKAQKIVNTFIKAFKTKSILHGDGLYYLHGNFNITGTQSHRLSSSNPNLQNLPSGSTYGKLIKNCFISPPGQVMCGADYASLEDRISALLTKDPAKIKVYTDGYDSHCLRAYAYFKDQMPDIVDTVESINSIKKKYDQLRSDSKMPTFLLTYMGSWKGMMEQGDFTEQEAKAIEKNYHELYGVSDKWVENKIKQACITGFVPLAFGGRLRTPILAQVIFGDRMPYKAHEEARSAGNALGQSYSLLNSRAAIEFMNKVWESKYRYEIKPIAQIHDASYYIGSATVGCIKFINDNLGRAMSWQELPEIMSDDVKLSGELDLFYPSWKKAITLKNNASKCEIIDACK